MPRAEPCPIPGCLEPKLRGHLMCRDHWRSLPMVIRGAIWSAWKAVREPWRGGDYQARIKAIKEYRDASQTAIDHIMKKEGIDVSA